MKTRHIFILGIVFLVLVALVVSKKIFMKPQVETAEYKDLTFSLTAEDIYSFEISKGKEEKLLRLEKKGNIWFVPQKWNARAKEEKVKNFLKDIEELKGELRSDSEKLFSDYGISDDEAFSISFYDNKGNLSERLLIGTKKAGGGGSFIRREGSPKVYLTDKDIFYMLSIYGDPKEAELNIENWLDLSIVKADVEKINFLKITRLYNNERKIILEIKKELDTEKKQKRWVTSTKPLFPIDAAKIRKFLKRLSRINAKEIIDPKGEDYGFNDPYLNFTFGMEERENFLELVVGKLVKKDSEDRYLKTPEGYVYIFPGYKVKEIDIDISKFFIDNPLRVDRENLKELVIKSQDKTIRLDEILISKNANYIDKLKRFKVDKILFWEKEALRELSEYSLSIMTKKGDTYTIDFEKRDDLYIAKLKTNPTLFSISKATFREIFEDLDKLNLKVEEKKTETAKNENTTN